MGKHNIEKTAKAKWNTAQKKLNDVVTSKKSDAMKKLKSEKNSKEKVGKGKVNMERTQKNVSAAGKMSAAAAKAFGTASEKKGNQKSCSSQGYQEETPEEERLFTQKEEEETDLKPQWHHFYWRHNGEGCQYMGNVVHVLKHVPLCARCPGWFNGKMAN